MSGSPSPRVAAGQRRRWLSYAIGAVVVLLDQLSKAWALEQLTGHGSQRLLPGLLDLQLTFNTGAAFSLFTGSTRPLAVVSAVVAVAVVVWMQRQRELSRWRLWAVGLLLGGAIGNGIDRWRLGAVVDFLALVPIHFPVFNLADVAINAAVACFLLELLLQRQRP
ncbi:MAG: Lipoprotein signal peptidase [Cyanobacteriota bacterium]